MPPSDPTTLTPPLRQRIFGAALRKGFYVVHAIDNLQGQGRRLEGEKGSSADPAFGSADFTVMADTSSSNASRRPKTGAYATLAVSSEGVRPSIKSPVNPTNSQDNTKALHLCLV
jgi:hypothetical protein